MALIPTSADEPAIQDALVAVVLQLVLGAAGSAGFVVTDNVKAAGVTIIAGIVGALVSYVQAKSTRGKVFAPVTVDQKTADATAYATASALGGGMPDTLE